MRKCLADLFPNVPLGVVARRARARAHPLLHWWMPARQRTFADVSASADVIAKRREAGAELRGVYHNSVVARHNRSYLIRPGPGEGEGRPGPAGGEGGDGGRVRRSYLVHPDKGEGEPGGGKDGGGDSEGGNGGRVSRIVLIRPGERKGGPGGGKDEGAGRGGEGGGGGGEGEGGPGGGKEEGGGGGGRGGGGRGSVDGGDGELEGGQGGPGGGKDGGDSGSDGDGGDSDSDTCSKAEGVVHSILTKPKQVEKVLKVSGEAVVSERIRGHLTAIATALVDEMVPGIRNAVGEDPRIQKRFIRSKRQIEKAVLRDYKRELSQKRKDRLNVMRAASEFALSGLSSKAYAAIRSALCKAGLKKVLFTEKDLRAARREITEKAEKDLSTYSTPDGWFISVRAAVEAEILRAMQIVNAKETRKEVACRTLDCNLRWEDPSQELHICIGLY